MAIILNWRDHILFFVICTTVTNSVRTQAEVLVIPYKSEIKIVNEGESLSLTCDFDGVNNIDYPKDDPVQGISTSEHNMVPERYYNDDGRIWNSIKWTFHRKNLVFGDTGLYSCYDGRRTFYILNKYLQPDYGFYYVYVKSPQHLFVQTKQNSTLIADIGDAKLRIPCRPTSPDLQVDLINVQTNNKVILNENNTYDPKLGFHIKLSSDLDGGIFKCSVESDLRKSEIFYHIKIFNFELKAPIIHRKTDNQFAAEGENLRINCSLPAFETNSIEATWITPRKSNFRKVRQYKMTNENKTKITLELIVENITIDDTGMYICQLVNVSDLIAEFLYVEVGEAIEVKRMWEPITEHDDFKLRCNSWLGHSTKSIEWFKGSESISENVQERVNVQKEIFNHTHISFAKRADLNIKSINDSDKGAYLCKVTRYDNSTTIVGYNVTKIHMPEPPTFNDTNLKNNTVTLLRSSNKVQYLFCQVIGMPPPSVVWYKNGTLFENTTRGDDDWNHRYSIFLFPRSQNIAGNYSCIGTNRVGKTDQQNIEIELIDRVKPSFIWISFVVSTMIIIIILIIYTSCKISLKKAKRKALIEIGLICPDETYLQTLHLNVNADEQIQNLPFSEKWELNIKKLKLGKQLGQGEFGVVLKAEAQDILDEDNTLTVNVKLVSKKADHIHMKSIVNELKILIYVGKHMNLLNLIGVCTDRIIKNELLLILEYSCFGNVCDYLRSHREHFIHEIDSTTGKIVPFVDHAMALTPTLNDNACCKTKKDDPSNLDSIAISKNSSPGWRSKYSGDYNITDVKSIYTRDLLSWSFQIACAMEHLGSKKIVHGDLALETVLLGSNNVIKLCDIGVARILLADDNYKREHEERLPYKWMAIESINQTRCSLQSDVWSFGVVLWELFTLAGIPYGDTLNEQLYEKLLSGYRLDKPQYAIQEIYDIMLACWQEDPIMRPNFDTLVEQIGALLDDSVREQLIEMKDSYTEKRVQFISEDIHLERTSSLEFENAMSSEGDLNESADYLVMETKL